MMTLIKQLEKEKEEIKKYLHLGNVKFDKLISELDKYISNNFSMNNEQLWTFLLASGHAIAGSEGIEKMTELLTGKKLVPKSKKIWFEVLPLPPRAEEGNTNLDLAIGQISQRKSYKSGIKLSEHENKWVCFCEMKWNSDISTSVAHDPYRNQLLRVIENAVTFQNNNGSYAENVYVTLVTPEKYKLKKKNSIKSKLYHYKYAEYKNKNNIIKEFEACNLNYYNNQGWVYPDNINERIDSLKLNHKSYDELFDNLKRFKGSALNNKIIEFWNLFGTK